MINLQDAAELEQSSAYICDVYPQFLKTFKDKCFECGFSKTEAQSFTFEMWKSIVLSMGGQSIVNTFLKGGGEEDEAW
jgi:hypothetical protein